MKYRKKPVVIDAERWFKPGDHPEVVIKKSVIGLVCKNCKKFMRGHGWIKTLEGGHIVCAGDWIITGVKGECYPCKPDIFEATYESI